MLRRRVGEMGLEVHTRRNPARISGNDCVEALELDDGTSLPAEAVVICTGIRPNMALAVESGLETNKSILVDEYLRTSAENVYAIGECTEFESGLIGLVAPGLTQMRIALSHMLGEETEPYRRVTTSTNLKVMGIDLASAGDVYGTEPGSDALVSSNPLEGTYRKAVIRDGVAVGAVLFGDLFAGAQLADAVKRSAPAEEVAALTVGAGGDTKPSPLPDEAQVCGCNGVTKGQVVVAIQEKGANSVSAIGADINAGTGCRSCKQLVGEILSETAEGPIEEEESYLCKCMRLTQDDVRSMVRERGLTSVSQVGEACGAGKVCSNCKVGLTYVVSEANMNRHGEERHAQHINDRVHANIQNDGTFSIVPRTYGGVTSPDELRRIADVADKYEARMVKITGSQRLDILGVRKEDLPKAWADLGMPASFSYTKTFRQVKTCVGTEF
jgi:nitrite reductase (NADH) large subunit